MHIDQFPGRYYPDEGGVQRCVREHLRHFPDRKTSFRIVAMTFGPGMPPHDRVDGIPVLRFPSTVGVRGRDIAAGVWRELATTRADIVHTHSIVNGTCLGALLLCRRPLVVSTHYHGVPPRGRGPSLVHLQISRLTRRARHLIFSSEGERTRFFEDFPEARVASSVAYPSYSPELLSAEPFPIDRPVILYVGRLAHHKRVDHLIASFTRCRNRDAILMIVGEGPEDQRLQQLAAELRVGDRVVFQGRAPEAEVMRWQRTATCAVSLSAEEAFGIAVLEGAVAGARLVISDIAPHREVNALAGRTDTTFLPLSCGLSDVASALDAAVEMGATRMMSPIRAPSWADSAGVVRAVYEQVLS